MNDEKMSIHNASDKKTNLKVENEILTKKLTNIETALKFCQNKEINQNPILSKESSDTLIKDLLS